MQDDYWEQSVQPLNCFTFVVPLLALYEIGVVSLGSTAMRNGADVWLRESLSRIGFADYFFLPLMACGLLLGWHHLSRREWKLRTEVLSGMVCESFVLGATLVIVAQVCGDLFHTTPSINAVMPFSDNQTIGSRIPLILSYLGAGIYEELLFRLLLLSGTITVCRKLGADHFSANILAVVSTSLLFAAAHYALFFQVGFDFSWYTFVFRMSAGALFSLLFLRRGFGIVVGTHCVYDILVATLV